MAVRKNRPMQGRVAACAAIVSLAIFAAAPVLAAPGRSICKDATAATLDVANAEFATTTDARTDEVIEMLGPNFELAARERAVEEDGDQEQAEQAAEDDTGVENGDTALPAEAAGPLVFKRQMYRRDI